MTDIHHESEDDPVAIGNPVEDRRMGELLARLDADAAPVDHRKLAELRGHSAAIFARGSAPSERASQKTNGNTETRSMSFSLTRLFAVAAAIAIAVTGWMWSDGSGEDDHSFGQVMNKVAASESLELKLTRDGQTEQVWVKSADGQPQLRWNRADGTYRIARGEQAWDVNEQANQAKLRPDVHFGKSGVNVFALLGLQAIAYSSPEMAAAEPAEQVERDGAKLDVYRWDVPAVAGGVPLKIEAFVHADTQLLASIAAEEAGGVAGSRRARTRLDVVAVNRPVDDSLFVVGDTLTDDGRIGKVTDVQGIVTIKPAMGKRWTPVTSHMLLRPGDWLRTDVRGANAVTLRLVKDTLVTFGPGSLVEIQSPSKLRVSSGEMKVVTDENAPVELVGTGENAVDQRVSASGTAIYRLQNERFVPLAKPPLWLAGFEGTTNNESLGSLVAQVDGRDVPLTVGYHKVTVDIRDQIARTVIEESFVNHTRGRLEGVFHFPLPQDASIAGFGMWIGNELVEADVVEKQRAREIYEEILRERRDPGLLEWTGGNIFKARVFPIEPYSEKRIKISYTQVLPLSGKSYRYSYGLRSELLKQNPLRELAIDLKLNSVLPLAAVYSPTHASSRGDRTTSSAHLEFTAQEYTPERDFEVVVELADAQPNLALVPHRRGDDGYFMLMITPEQLAQQQGDGPARELLADDKPLNLLILADTSASMDAASREVQADFIASLLASLNGGDRFNLATCDVASDWAFPEPAWAEEENVTKAREMLAGRVSLGWTDLDMAFESALKQAAPGTQIIYVGDGIITTKGADPVAFAKRLAQLCQGKGATLHAVSVSSSFEPLVLKAIASVGGGSVRQVSGERTPQSTALELLSEISKPTLRNIKVEFAGIQTARVYPSELPNMPAGSQQIVLGRYLPTAADQLGEVIVTAMQGDKPIEFRQKVTLPLVAEAADAEEDLSFIPRLWARMHLDALLAQGTSQEVQDDIIELSEEYHIITPYTSLLVLESDADRERFGVKRRFQMRDAERFFAQGRDNANFELMAQQMQRAGTWRVGLRQQMLAQLIGLGRDPNAFDPQVQQMLPQAREEARKAEKSLTITGTGFMQLAQTAGGGGGGYGGGSRGRGAGRAGGRGGRGGQMPSQPGGGMPAPLDIGGFAPNARPYPVMDMILPVSGSEGWGRLDVSGFLESDDAKSEFGTVLGLQDSIHFDGFDREMPLGPMSADMPLLLTSMRMKGLAAASSPFNQRDGFGAVGFDGDLMLAGGKLKIAEEQLMFMDEWNGEQKYLKGNLNLKDMLAKSRKPTGAARRSGYYEGNAYQYTAWVDQLFPALSALPAYESQFDLQKPWSDEIRALVAGLTRTNQLAALPGGLKVERHNESFDPRWNTLAGREDTLELVSPAAWLVRSGGFGSQTIVQWCDKEERGIFGEAFQLGRRTKSSPPELARPPLGLAAHLLRSLERQYANYDAKLEPAGENQARLVLTHESNPGYEVRILIDTARRVIVSIENRQNGEVATSVQYDQFVEIAGAWYAGQGQVFDKEGRRTSLTTEKLTPLDAGVFATQMAQQLASRERVQFVKLPMPTIVEAKRALKENKATFEDRLLLLLVDCTNQQWEAALSQVAALEELGGWGRAVSEPPAGIESDRPVAGGSAQPRPQEPNAKPGLRWVRDAILNDSRRREELRQRVLEFATQLVKPEGGPVAESETQFLASRCIVDSGTFEANELLALLDLLKPVFERQPLHLAAMKTWTQARIAQLQKVGRPNEALALQKEIAEKWPHDYSLQSQYALMLSGAGEWNAAYAWLDKVTTDEAQWRDYEEQQLRSTYCDLLNQQGRWTDMLDYLTRWIARKPATSTAYERYLATLLKLDRIDEMNATIAKWLEDGKRQGRLPGDVSARLQAAVQRALGRGHDIYTYRLDERWLDPLAGIARFFVRNELTVTFADQVMNDGNFQPSDQCRQLRREFLAILQEEQATLKQPLLDRLVNWIWPNDPAVEADVWRELAKRLEARWVAIADAGEKLQLGATIVRVNGRLTPAEQLTFLRRQLNEGPEKNHPQFARDLFTALIAQPWTAELENEAFGLVMRLSSAETPAQKLYDQVRAIHQLTDRMVLARYEALMAKVEHQEELTRTQLRDKQLENTRLARLGFADRLDKARGELGDALNKWLLIERLYLDVQSKRDLEKVAENCWELLGPPPASGSGTTRPADEKSDADAVIAAYLNATLRSRALVMLANLSVRKEAKPELVIQLIDYLDKAIAAAKPQIAAADEQPADQLDAADLPWKTFKYRLLVALDRPKELEDNLRAWTQGEDPLNYWRVALAYLAAEHGKLEEAIALFETVEKANELGPDEFRTLADWFMAVSRPDKHEAALETVISFTDENQLSNWLYQQLQPWRYNYNNQPMPTELEPNVFRAFSVLFKKSAVPQNYAYQLREFYRATHDFRLLAGMGDAVVGHTAGRVYPFLQGLDNVFGEVREEATVDSLEAELEKVRVRLAAAPRTPLASGEPNIDLRALDLLEAVIHRRAAEQLNQPGPHAQKAIVALKRAFDRQWSPGEERLMASLLGGMGNISEPALAAEQTRELRELFARVKPGTIDRLEIGQHLAACHWNYARQPEAIALLESALDEYRTAKNGVLPPEANSALTALVSYLEQSKQHARGEQVLFTELKRPANPQQVFWLRERIYQLYNEAIRGEGTVSLGSGAALYSAVQKQLQDELDTPDHNHRQNLVNQLITIFRTAKEKNIPGHVADLRAFAFERLPAVLRMQTNNFQYMVSNVSQVVRELISPREALDFLVTRMEQEPSWFRYANQDGWQQFGYQLAQWRQDSQQANSFDSALSERLLAIVVRELRRDLESRNARQPYLYHSQYSHFWAEKAADFRRTAEAVYAERKSSGEAVKYIANYLFHGIRAHERAIEIMLVAYDGKLLDENGQSTLAQYLQDQARHGESIAILQPLMELRPDDLGYRTRLMRAYSVTGRRDDLLALLRGTDEHFHKDGRWTEDAMSRLGYSCLENQLFVESVAYYEELIPHHQRSRPDRGIGTGTLSQYYGYLADGYSGLGNTVKAVDAACGAIVSWGPTHQNRVSAVQSLRGVLQRSRNLDSYVAELDKQVEESGLENPIVRKSLGQVFYDQNQIPKAIKQLELARQSQPNDAETHSLLVQCYDRVNDRQGAVRQLLASVELSRRNIELYQDLGRRYQDMNQPAQAERARTAIVEMQPNESESHTMLADIRQQQNRWNDAIEHWKRVAEIRKLEPTGLIKLAEAQIHQQAWNDAAETLRKLDLRDWPERFNGNEQQIRELRRRIEQRSDNRDNSARRRGRHYDVNVAIRPCIRPFRPLGRRPALRLH